VKHDTGTVTYTAYTYAAHTEWNRIASNPFA